MKYKNKSSNKIKKVTIKYQKVLPFLVVIFLVILFFQSYYVIVFKKEYYQTEKELKENVIIKGESTPRGFIYDRNKKIIVNNKPVKVIYYKNPDDITLETQLLVAKKLATLIEVDDPNISITTKKEYYLAVYPNKKEELVTNSLNQQLLERKITRDELDNIILTKIDDADLINIDLEEAAIYKLMRSGYYFDEKTIKKIGVTDKEYAIVAENLKFLPGVGLKLDFERNYLYSDLLKSVLGKVSNSRNGITKETQNYYTVRNYSLNDRVGLTGLEKEYETYLKGEKPVYKVTDTNKYELITSGKRGHDLVLTVDIELQNALEKILTEEVINAKKELNAEYYDHTFVIMGNPKTGEIYAMAGKKIINDQIYDYTGMIIKETVTPGSIVKGASIMVGYDTGAIEIGTTFIDECIKVKATPEKCSWKNLGLVDDLAAIKLSSNVYQFKTAIRVGGSNYNYNAPLLLDEEAFKTYRKMYESFGLGIKSGIDLPEEAMGYKGSSKQSGLLLDFSIGQYDTYTPIQIFSYINTIANNGYRTEPYLLKDVYLPEVIPSTLVYHRFPKALGKIKVDDIYIERVKEGFRAVMLGGTGTGYINEKYLPAGKTGTSESFIDTDNDGNIDTKTITTNFIGYAPYDDPILSIVVISPNIAHRNTGSSFKSNINKRITNKITEKFFELY